MEYMAGCLLELLEVVGRWKEELAAGVLKDWSFVYAKL